MCLRPTALVLTPGLPPAQVEARLRQLEGRTLGSDSAVKGKGKGEAAKYDSSKQARAYNADADAAPMEVEKKEKKDKVGALGGWGWGWIYVQSGEGCRRRSVALCSLYNVPDVGASQLLCFSRMMLTEQLGAKRALY